MTAHSKPVQAALTLDGYWAEVTRVYRDNDRWRWGQAAFNVLARVRPDLSEPLRGSPTLDPFHAVDSREPRCLAFVEYVNRRWGGGSSDE